MSRQILDEVGDIATSAAIDICWRQWHALGAPAEAVDSRRPETIADPEALLLLSMAIYRRERRLMDLVAWFARAGARFVSVQRFMKIAASFPKSTQEGIPSFATLAVEAGDRRWKKLIRQQPQLPRRAPKGKDRPRLTEPAALMLRLRAAFGIGVKADLLTFLIGLGGRASTAHRVATAIGYSKPSIHEATTDMALARVLRRTSERPAAYFVDPIGWTELLGGTRRLSTRRAKGTPAASHQPTLPEWRFWVPVFVFLANTHDFTARQEEELSPYLLSSRFRDLYYEHTRAFSLNQIPVPNPEDYPGDEYLDGFRETVRRVSNWVAENA